MAKVKRSRWHNGKQTGFMKSIYHYTSIKSLALILKSGRIRFSRLDQLDDIKEIDGIPFNAKSYFYISCWTDTEEENLSLWSLQAGVRIELPQKFFKEYTYTGGDYGNWGFTGPMRFPLRINEIRTDEYLISNPFWLDDGFFVKVIYDENHLELKNQAIKQDSKGIKITHAKNLVTYKSPVWKFQNESRFYLMAVALPPLANYGGDRLRQMKDMCFGMYANKVRFIDVEIDPSILDQIIVRLHPGCDEADKLIVDALLKSYTKNGKIEESHLNGTYRRR